MKTFNEWYDYYIDLGMSAKMSKANARQKIANTQCKQSTHNRLVSVQTERNATASLCTKITTVTTKTQWIGKTGLIVQTIRD